MLFVYSHDVVSRALARICTGSEERCVVALRRGTEGGEGWGREEPPLDGLFLFFLFKSILANQA